MRRNTSIIIRDESLARSDRKNVCVYLARGSIDSLDRILPVVSSSDKNKPRGGGGGTAGPRGAQLRRCLLCKRSLITRDSRQTALGMKTLIRTSSYTNLHCCRGARPSSGYCVVRTGHGISWTAPETHGRGVGGIFSSFFYQWSGHCTGKKTHWI